MSKITNSRINMIMVGFTMVAFGILLQIFRVQHNPNLVQASEDLAARNSNLYLLHESERGRIYDANGNLLAGSKTVYSIGFDLSEKFFKGGNPLTLANTVMEFFGDDFPLDYETLYQFASTTYDKDTAVYIPLVLLNSIPQETIDELAALKEYYQEQKAEILEKTPKSKREEVAKTLPSLAGLTWEPHLQRYYPEDEVAANILGFTTFLNLESKVGMFGLEEYYQDKLITQNTTSIISWMPYEDSVNEDIPIGQSLVLTIDRNIQEEVETILDAAVEKYMAESGVIIVMDPKTGAIMAMASNPRANPNEYWNWYEAIGEENSYNKAIMDTYEPGSVFKIITMAIGLETGSVTPETTYNDTGVIIAGGREVNNWNYAGMGLLDMTACLKKSSNVCLAWVGDQKIGAEKFYAGLHAFGLDRRTNVDLAGESLFPLKEPGTEDWWPADLGRQSYGHSIAVTPIQMATAISAIPNGGKIMAPHVLKSMVVNGVQYDNIPQMIANPISEETAAVVNEMLIIAESQEIAETWNAYIPGYTMSGKTGTALIANENGYSDNLTNATFVGWGPTEDPQFLIYVWLEQPKYDTYASIVAAPVFKEVAEYLITVMDIPPDDIRLALTP